MLRRLVDWLMADRRARIAQLHASLDVLEERFVALRADAYRRFD